MAQTDAISQGRLRKAFSLIEIPQIGIVICILAALVGLPHLLLSDEQSKACEAFQYLANVGEAQQEYRWLHGTYADRIADLDMRRNTPTYFSVGRFAGIGEAGLQDGWSLTLTRSGGRTGGYGDYTVTFTHNGYDPSHSDIAEELCPPGL